MIDPSTIDEAVKIALTTLAGDAAMTTLKTFLNGLNSTERLQRAAERAQTQWTIDQTVALQARMQVLEAQLNNESQARERLEERLADPQFERVLLNYGVEGYREAIDERRRMLAFAQIGSINVDLTLAEVARVERIIRDLDPDDVRLLHDVVHLSFEELQINAEDQIFAAHRQSAVVLAASGCIFPRLQTNVIVDGSPTESSVTELGRLVLKVMQGYLNSLVPALPAAPM